MVFRRQPWVGYGEVTVADDLAASIHIEGGAAGAIERAQVDYSARRRPHECTKRVTTKRLSFYQPDDLALVIHCLSLTNGVTRSEIDRPCLLRPEERMLHPEAVGRIAKPDYLAARVHRLGRTEAAIGGVSVEIDHSACARP